MKHSTKIICIELALIIASLFCMILFSISYYTSLTILIILAIAISIILKPEKRKERFNTDILLITTIAILFYYAITYFIGFFSGFFYSTYSKKILGILYNIGTSLITIYSIETIREVLIKNNAYHKSIVWLTPIICFLLEIPMLVNMKIYNTRVDIFNAILTLLVPALLKNITLTYITYKSNKNNSIVYQLLLKIPYYLLPVVPNLGDFFTIIIDSILPIIILILIMNISTIKFDKVINSRKLAQNKIMSRCINIVVFIILFIMIYLTSNVFRFASLAIGSGSMKGSINKGDIVIIDKKVKQVNKNDIIAFREQGRVVVHRMIGIKEKNGIRYYQTKGDANKSKDGWLVSKGNVVGKVKARIRWLGWPTVALSELLQG